MLSRLLGSPGHQFWPDNVSLMDTRLCPSLTGSQHLTNQFLLALAVKHGGRFATFDARINASLVPGGHEALYVIPTV